MRRSLGALWLAALLGACGGEAAGPRLLPGERRSFVHPGALHELQLSPLALAVTAAGGVQLAWSRRDAGGGSLWTARGPGAAPVRVDPPGHAAAPSHDATGLALGPEGRVHVLWTARRSAGEGAPVTSELLLSTSHDAGASFGPPLLVAGGPRSHDFASLATTTDGTLLVAWLEIGGPVAGARSARVDPEAGRVSDLNPLEESACVCCRTALAVGPGDGVGVLWRGERAGSVRDMFWARSADGGRRFGTPRAVHADGWKLDACPHRGGSLAFDASGRAFAAWYTEGERARPSLRLASAAPGADFAAPYELRAGGDALPDRPALAVAADGSGLVVFESATSVRREIVARALAARQVGPARVLSEALQASGPSAAALPRGGFAVAWHEEAFPGVRTVVLEVAIPPR